MARTKRTARKQSKLVGKVLQSHVQRRAMNTAKPAVIIKPLPKPISDFCIPVTKAELSMDQWNARSPHRIHYGVPELTKYGVGDNAEQCLRVPVVKDHRLLGYVPLPTRYSSSWVYLCYCVEYWLAIWKCWDVESKKKQRTTKNTNIKAQEERKGLIDIARRNASARFLQAMVARRTVLEECIDNGVNDDERINSLDEFMIRNHRDWLFLEFDELPHDADIYLQADPLHAGNKKLFESDWGVNMDDIQLMLGGTDNAWMSKGLDLSEMFKESRDGALEVCKSGGKGTDIIYDENAELPDKWHESHEPPIRFVSQRKDEFLRQGFTLDEPLVFFYYCLRAEEEIERGDFLREIMDMLATDETQQHWSSCVDQLIDSEITWNDFCDLLAEELDLELDQRVNSMVSDGVEPDNPFSNLDAKIALRAYFRNLTSKPESAADMFYLSINRFSKPDATDLEVWGWVLEHAQPETVTTVLMAAHNYRSDKPNGRKGDGTTFTGHTDDANPCSLGPSSDTRPPPPTKAMQSNIEVDDAEAASRGNGPDNIVMDSEQSAASSHGHVHSNAGEKQGDQLTTPPNTPPEHTSDAIFEYQDGSQFTAEREEDGRSTGNDNFIPESLFSLANVQRAIEAFGYDGISFNEFRNILLTDIPPIHVKTVHDVLQTLHPGRTDMKTLNTLLKTLQEEEEEALAMRDTRFCLFVTLVYHL
ncbi:hypothetical protein DFJ58DRAFT_736774 [Suillus subalutaceus]|uniref:uncharacterized protein n=1 Tax=Suillus subalutaceus TaxID=48586 RepID=UPI001B8687A3|nr:uncharacterized protein DFJ58DRAFT_736774 [Suillus subalutaceus]KAG1830990.1 hypothetical protein DFJ58DRAFT_736774 [Suillus subalutaceus]